MTFVNIEMFVEFVNPYYTDVIRNYVAVPFPTGEKARLWTNDGDLIAEEDNPRGQWPELLAMAARDKGYDVTDDDINDVPQLTRYE